MSHVWRFSPSPELKCCFKTPAWLFRSPHVQPRLRNRNAEAGAAGPAAPPPLKASWPLR